MVNERILQEISRDDYFSDAVRYFWDKRASQAEDQNNRGVKDQGSRSEATGGKHMDGFFSLIETLLLDVGVPAEDICTRKRNLDLPGFFRAEKQWDLIVIKHRPEGEKELVAVLELKSQKGPSFGNNINNRTEEVLGSAYDLWTAYREGAFKTSPSPWLGYMLLLEDCDKSRKSVRNNEPHFDVFPEFKNASYAERYHQTCLRLVRERVYSEVCYLLADQEEKMKARNYSEPDEMLAGTRFLRSLCSHLNNFYELK
ncbi:PaeR7I family type II restriction endonuclease [Methanofollis fontis]|uniref:Restriction endonuclease n=1 Tax=Methanofollis fontis TaxID=2052832 RepID=A0A483CL98_9EURY|nr:PaeR7I family type II restriction endonuclease [Methanofollis fontis]TAJ43718.1 restriction endonuclease [Methanofollis fontis]